MNGGDFEDFSKQEDKLKLVQDHIERLQPLVEAAERQHSDVMISIDDVNEEAELGIAMGRLRSDWSRMSGEYSDRHKRFELERKYYGSIKNRDSLVEKDWKVRKRKVKAGTWIRFRLAHEIRNH